MKNPIKELDGFMISSFALGMLFMFLLQLLLVDLGTNMIAIAIGFTLFVIGIIIEYNNLREYYGKEHL